MQQQAADRVSRASAVVEQFGVITVAALFGGVAHVLRKRIEQVGQQGYRQLKGAQHLAQRVEYRRPLATVRLVTGNGQQVSAELRQHVQPLRGAGVAFVGQVIGRAGKVVNGGNGRTQVRWAQHGRHRKVFVVLYGLN